MKNVLEPLPQYHFKRDDFCRVFGEVFTQDEIFTLEVECQGSCYTDSFHLFYDNDEFYIIHKDSGIIINYYKHLGRTNTCNRSDFTLDDLRIFLKELKEDLKDERII